MNLQQNNHLKMFLKALKHRGVYNILSEKFLGDKKSLFELFWLGHHHS